MKVTLTVKDIHSQMGQRPVNLATADGQPKLVQSPIHQIVMQDDSGDTQFNLAIITYDQNVVDRYQLGQEVEMNLHPKGKLVAVEGEKND